MTPKERAAMQQALGALVRAEALYGQPNADIQTALREALAGVDMSPTEQAECKDCDAKQAQIDRLMLEYCPDEMTPEQVQEWRDNQRPAEQAEQEPVAKVVLNRANQIVLKKPNGDYFDISKHVGECFYSAPVRTKDLTPHEITALIREGAADGGWQGFAQRVIAADRKLNGVDK